MIAEDEALIRLDLAEMLAEAGYDIVAQAGDGEEAVALTMEHRPDLVVMDVKMPRLDGIAAAAQIARDRIAPVVMLTAFSQRELVERARDSGAMAYLVKPFTITDLVPAIEMAMSRFAEITGLEREVDDLTERLEARKAIERAKSTLQEALGLTEPEAFGWIQRTAMDLRLTMHQVAQQVIEKGPELGRDAVRARRVTKGLRTGTNRVRDAHLTLETTTFGHTRSSAHPGPIDRPSGGSMKRSTKTIRLAAVAAASTLVLAACGGGDERRRRRRRRPGSQGRRNADRRLPVAVDR